jgi:hypothetical protein
VRVLPCDTKAGALNSHQSDEIHDLAVSDVGLIRQLAGLCHASAS